MLEGALVILGLFSCWSTWGFATLVALGVHRNPLRRILLAPVTGLAIHIVLSDALTALGFGTRVSAWPLAIVLTIASVAVFFRWRPTVAGRAALPYVIAALASSCLLGRPLATFGTHWTSYGNNDMADYILGAQWFYSHGLFAFPEPSALLRTTDAGAIESLYYSLVMIRPSGPVLQAVAMALTGLDAASVSMSLMLALHAVLVITIGAFAYGAARFRIASLAATIFAAISPLLSLGTLSELLPQDIGLSIMLGFVASFSSAEKRGGRRIILDGLLLGALAHGYPEVFPFAALTVGAYLLHLGLRNPRALIRVALAPLAASAAVAVLFTNVYSIGAVMLLQRQFAGSAAAFISVFPAYLTPQGFASYWGIVSIGNSAASALLQPGIAGGFALSTIVTVAIVRMSLRGYLPAMMAAVMGALAVYLFAHHADFGLYKIAMYAQPATIATLCAIALDAPRAAARRVRRFPTAGRLAFALLGSVLFVVQLTTQNYYVERSYGSTRTDPTLIDLPDGSESNLIGQLSRLRGSLGGQVVTDATNLGLIKYEAAYTKGHAFGALVADPFADIMDYLSAKLFFPGLVFEGEHASGALASAKERKARVTPLSFDMHDSKGSRDAFVVADTTERDALDDSTTLLTADGFGVMNGESASGPSQSSVRARPIGSLRNFAILQESDLGQSSFPTQLNGIARTALYSVQPDPYFAGRELAASGRYILLRVLKPSTSVRVCVSFSSGIGARAVPTLGSAAVVGATRVKFAHGAAGAERVCSDPLQPQSIDGASFLLLDLGIATRRTADVRQGLMALYGTGIPFDYRSYVGFVRDISVIDGTIPAATTATEISKFPADLEAPSLLFSGIFEDGWISRDFLASLHNAPGGALRIRGSVPSIPGVATGSHLEISVDDKSVYSSDLPPGAFDIVPFARATVGDHIVRLHFDHASALPGADGRQVSALIDSIGFVPAAQRPDIADASAHVGAGWYDFERYAGATFRWIRDDAQIAVDDDRAKTLLLDVEPGPGAVSLPIPLTVAQSGAAHPTVVEISGRQTVAIPLAPGRNRILTLSLPAGRAVPPDPRVLVARVFSVRTKS